MPEYLKFDTDLSDVSPEEVAEILAKQDEHLKAVVDRLNASNPVEADLLECVVSV